MNIIETIKQHQSTMSKTEKKVSEYIIDNPESVERYTISKLADVTHTSTSAVLRFTQGLGFKGYKDFRFEMMNFLNTNHIQKDPNDLLDQLTNDYINTISLFKNLDRNLINELILCLKQKKPLYIMGIYYSSLPAIQLSYGLEDLGIKSQLITDYIKASHATDKIEDNAVFVQFSINGSKTNISKFMSNIMTNMPKDSYLITMNPNAQIKSYFHHVIVIPGYTFTNKSIVDTQSLMLVFVELLLNLLHND